MYSEDRRMSLTEAVLSGIAAILAAWLLTHIIINIADWWKKLTPPCDLPILNLKGWGFAKARQEYLTNLDYYLEIGRQKYRETGYQLWSPEGYKVILPPRYYEEIGVQSDDVMSTAAARSRIMGGYNSTGVKEKEMDETITFVRRHLQTALPTLGNDVSNMIQANMFKEFPYEDDWTELALFPGLLAVVAATSTSLIFGKELAHDPAILDAAMTYPLDIISAGLKLRSLIYPLKVIAVEFGLMSETVKLRSRLKYIRQVVPRVLRAREQANLKYADYKKPNDFLQWIYEGLIRTDPKRSVDELGSHPLMVMTAAVSMSTTNLVNVVHHIAWYPEYNDTLRDEVDRLWNDSGGNINIFNSGRLEKLDSYIMEASRHGMFKRLLLDRNVVSPNGFTFSNGLHLKRNGCLAIDVGGQESDPLLWGEPTVFQPYRFSDARASATPSERKLWFTSTNPTYALHFSHGKHSCPGRGFATLLLKCFLATLLREWEVVPIEGKEGVVNFPQSVDKGTVSMPPVDVHLRFRKRKLKA